MSFTINGNVLAEVRIDSIDGQQALGFSRLTVAVALELRPRPQGQNARITDLAGGLMAQGRGGGFQYVGRLRPMNAPILIEMSQYAQSWGESLEVELDRQRLEAIEQLRQGGELTFTVNLRARVVVQPDTVHVVQEQQSYRVNQGTWAETLGHLGYAQTMLLEVPVPDAQRAPEMAEAVGHLAAAQQAMARGAHREAVGLCRDVLESISLALGDRDDQDTTFQTFFANTRSMDKATRLRLVRRALKVLSHPARHVDQVTVQIEWDRADAGAMISMLAALMAVLGRST